MKKMFGLIFFFLFIQCSCNSNPSQKTEPQNNDSKNAPKTNATNNKTENSNSADGLKRPLESYPVNLQMFCDMIYGSVLENIVFKDVFGKIKPTETLAVRRETIPHENIEKLRNLPEIDPALIDKLIERNTTTEKLRDGYDVKHSIKVVDTNSTNENLLVSLNQKEKDVKYLLGLSKSGFNKDFTQSLTYVEFYNLNKVLQKKYILITWDYSQGSMIQDTKWISAE